MAIQLPQGFKVGSIESIDSRLTLTKAEMLSINDNVMPQVYLTVCKDDSKLYIYNKENDVDTTTGKFRLYASGAGGADEDTFIFKEDLEVMYKLGKYEGTLATPATIPAAGKTLKEVWNDIFQNEVNPITTQPAVSITFAQAGSYEVGTTVTPSYSATLSAGSYTYGPATGITATAWEITNTDGAEATTASGSFNDVLVEDGMNYTITAKATHEAGSVPVTNLGNPYTAGQIQAGTKTKTSGAITGFRKIFWGYSQAETIDSAAIRALVGNKANAKLTNELLAENTSAKEIIIAAPKGTRTMVKVTMPSSSEADVTSQFIKQTDSVLVNGLNNYTWAEYDVWLYKPAEMAGTYKINMN